MDGISLVLWGEWKATSVRIDPLLSKDRPQPFRTEISKDIGWMDRAGCNQSNPSGPLTFWDDDDDDDDEDNDDDDDNDDDNDDGVDGGGGGNGGGGIICSGDDVDISFHWVCSY